MTDAIDPNATYDAAQVARLLFHVTLRTLRRRRQRLSREGFPKPISRWGKKVWSGAALLAWRDRQLIEANAEPDVIDYSAVLAERAKAAASNKRSNGTGQI